MAKNSSQNAPMTARPVRIRHDIRLVDAYSQERVVNRAALTPVGAQLKTWFRLPPQGRRMTPAPTGPTRRRRADRTQGHREGPTVAPQQLHRNPLRTRRDIPCGSITWSTSSGAMPRARSETSWWAVSAMSPREDARQTQLPARSPRRLAPAVFSLKRIYEATPGRLFRKHRGSRRPTSTPGSRALEGAPPDIWPPERAVIVPSGVQVYSVDLQPVSQRAPHNGNHAATTARRMG